MTYRGLGFAMGQEVGQIAPPIVYVRENVHWEYKTVEHELSAGPAIGEAELSALGEEGWEMAGVLAHGNRVSFYFKRMAD
jgi:hypothetical protein